jgi:hypothetical protein
LAKVTLDIDMRPFKKSNRYKWVLSGLKKGFYAGSRSRWCEIYEFVAQAADVPSMWMSGGSYGQLNYRNLPPAIRDQLQDLHVADRVAAKLAEYRGYMYPEVPRARDEAMQVMGYAINRKVVRKLAKQYASTPEYQAKVAPWIKKLEAGELTLVGDNQERKNGWWLNNWSAK